MQGRARRVKRAIGEGYRSAPAYGSRAGARLARRVRRWQQSIDGGRVALARTASNVLLVSLIHLVMRNNLVPHFFDVN